MDTTNKKVYDKPFWQAQGLKSFCKAKNDWFDFGKVHLSFVKHGGRPKCEQLAAIEGAVPFHGTDGALHLASMILSGKAAKLAKTTKEAAGENNYVKPFFSSMGGTPASRTKDGKCQFRQFSVAAGNRSDYVFQMMTCAGKENETGMIQPISGAERTTIVVPICSGDLVDFANSVQAEYNAYRVYAYANRNGGGTPHHAEESDPENLTAMEMDAPEAPAAAPAGGVDKVAILYDYTENPSFNRGLPVAVEISRAQPLIQDIVRLLLARPDRLVANPNEYNACIKKITDGELGNCLISFKGKKNPDAKGGISVVIDNLL